MDAERDEHRGKRDSELLRDAEEVRSDSHRLKHAMTHLKHARAAMDRIGGSEVRAIRGGKRKKLRGAGRD